VTSDDLGLPSDDLGVTSDDLGVPSDRICVTGARAAGDPTRRLRATAHAAKVDDEARVAQAAQFSQLPSTLR